MTIMQQEPGMDGLWKFNWIYCNLQIYDGKRGPLTETVGFLLEPYERKGYHLYHDIYYNSVHQTN